MTADYTGPELSVSPTLVLPQTGQKMQQIHDLDDGSVAVVSTASCTFFDIELRWDTLTQIDFLVIQDYWNDPTKAYGQKRSFYWLHPLDGRSYTAKFLSEFNTTYRVPDILSIDPIKVRIKGNKPDV